eukprot:1988178-Alexandrium_andersonii.AAC.1
MRQCPRIANFTTSGPLDPRFHRQLRNKREQLRRMHPSGASRTTFEAVPGPAQFKLCERPECPERG